MAFQQRRKKFPVAFAHQQSAFKRWDLVPKRVAASLKLQTS
jgi:hypothetical protein